MKIKTFFVPLLNLVVIFLMIGALLTTTVYAASTATVTATVTVQNISVSVSDGTVTYGTLGSNTAKVLVLQN